MSNQKYYKNRLGFDPREDGYEYSSPTPTKSTTPVRGGSQGYSESSDYGSPLKKSRQSTPSTLDASQGAYEDALTQFKGNMSMWEYFVEAKDKEGMCRKKKK